MTSEAKKTGVQTRTVSQDRHGQRLDNYLTARLSGVPRSAIYRIIRTGQVRVNGGRAKPFQKLKAGDVVRIPPVHTSDSVKARVPDGVVERIEASIVFEDESLLVCDKPSGIAVHGGSGLSWGLIEALRQSRQNDRLDLVHRLDRETSGILLVAKNGDTLRRLQKSFARREAQKSYLTLLHGALPGDLWTVDEPLLKQEVSGERFMVVDPRGKPSVTTFRRIDSYRGAAFVEATPITGRTHQIRAHARYLDAPCAGDSRYLDDQALLWWQKRGLERLFLHAHVLELPQEGKESLHFSCPLPEELNDLLNRL